MQRSSVRREPETPCGYETNLLKTLKRTQSKRIKSYTYVYTRAYFVPGIPSINPLTYATWPSRCVSNTHNMRTKLGPTMKKELRGREKRGRGKVAGGAGVLFASTSPSYLKPCPPPHVLRVCTSTKALVHGMGGVQRTASEAPCFWSSTPSPDGPEKSKRLCVDPVDEQPPWSGSVHPETSAMISEISTIRCAWLPQPSAGRALPKTKNEPPRWHKPRPGR